jgi:hypothetical protein
MVSISIGSEKEEDPAVNVILRQLYDRLDVLSDCKPFSLSIEFIYLVQHI